MQLLHFYDRGLVTCDALRHAVGLARIITYRERIYAPFRSTVKSGACTARRVGNNMHNSPKNSCARNIESNSIGKSYSKRENSAFCGRSFHISN
jgi:hypothetical protein